MAITQLLAARANGTNSWTTEGPDKDITSGINFLEKDLGRHLHIAWKTAHRRAINQFMLSGIVYQNSLDQYISKWKDVLLI